MARKEPVPDRERAIGFRLEEFRRSTKIPRTTFALTVGISGERLASYEKGRVPLRYGVFKAINKHFHIRLDWLMNGRGALASPGPFNDSRFGSAIDENELLSAVYDRVLSKRGDPDREEMDALFFGPGGFDARLAEVERIATNPKESRKLDSNLWPVVIDLLERTLKASKIAMERDMPEQKKYARAMKTRRAKPD